MGAIRDSSIEQRAFFADEPGGPGQTFFFNTLLSKVRSQGYILLVMASSAITTLLLTSGRTDHSRLRVNSFKCTISL